MATSAVDDRHRRLMLDAIQAASHNGTGAFAPQDVMHDVVKALKAGSDADMKRAVLSYFNELLRTGVIGLGDSNDIVGVFRPQYVWPNGHVHVTPHGKETFKHLSRDPINPAGYLAYLDQEAALDSVSRSYIEEALSTYGVGCYKATAVLVGAAVESLVLDLRNTLRGGLIGTGAKVPKPLEAWQVKTVLEAIAGLVLPALAKYSKQTGDDAIRQLHEQAESRLLPIAADFRRLRNDAGHPAALRPVAPADVHCNLLLFPATAKLLHQLKSWAARYYV